MDEIWPEAYTNYGHLEDDVRVKALNQNVASSIDVSFGGRPYPDLNLQRLIGVQVAM